MKELRKIAEQIKKESYNNNSEVSFKVNCGTNNMCTFNYTIGGWAAGPFEVDKDVAEKAYRSIAAFIKRKVKELE